MTDTFDNKSSSNMTLDARNDYLEAIRLIERLHRQFLEVVKADLDGRGIVDINNIQALILFNIAIASLQLEN